MITLLEMALLQACSLAYPSSFFFILLTSTQIITLLFSRSCIIHVLMFLLIACPHTSSMRAGCGSCSAVPKPLAPGAMPSKSWVSNTHVLDEWANSVSKAFLLSLLFWVTPRCFLAATPAYLVEEMRGGEGVGITCHLVFSVRLCLNMWIKR